MTSERTKNTMALDRLALFEQEHSESGATAADVQDFVANMKLRLEHGSPGDTIACFAREKR